MSNMLDSSVIQNLSGDVPDVGDEITATSEAAADDEHGELKSFPNTANRATAAPGQAGAHVRRKSVIPISQETLRQVFYLHHFERAP